MQTEEALVLLTKYHRRLAAAEASRYYRSFRAAEGIAGAHVPKMAADIEDSHLRRSLRFAGPVTVQRALRLNPGGVGAQVLTELSGTVSRHVLDAGRETIWENVRADTAAQGYTRVPTGRACSFCKMLASRGPTYSESGADFRSHNHCGCTAEPYFGGGREAWPEEARTASEEWNRATAGLSGPEATKAFRRSIEGR